MMTSKILIVEDDPEIVDLISLHLAEAMYTVDSAGDGESGLQKALTGEFGLLILDWRLPKLEGLEVCRQIRQQGSDLPIIMLTSRSAEIDRILGLEIGADDYVTKPFSPRELVTRVKAILRRVNRPAGAPGGEPPSLASGVSQAGKLSLNTITRKALWNTTEISLTALEFDLLLYFMKHQEHVLTREQLLNQVWGYTSDGYERVVTSYISRLRQKIEQAGAPELIRTVQGIGYKFALPDE